MTSVVPTLSFAPAPRTTLPRAPRARPGARRAHPARRALPTRESVEARRLRCRVIRDDLEPAGVVTVKGAFAAEEGVVEASLPPTSPAAALGDLAAAAPGAEGCTSATVFLGPPARVRADGAHAAGAHGRRGELSLVGYAGGFSTKGKDGKVCYYYGSPDTVYERLGHGEVVRTVLSDASPEKATEDLRAFAQTYFANFKKIRGFNSSGWTRRTRARDTGT